MQPSDATLTTANRSKICVQVMAQVKFTEHGIELEETAIYFDEID
jgi:hypothetical protein